MKIRLHVKISPNISFRANNYYKTLCAGKYGAYIYIYIVRDVYVYGERCVCVCIYRCVCVCGDMCVYIYRCVCVYIDVYMYI